MHLRDARQDEPGEDLDAPCVRRRRRHHPHRGRAGLAGELLQRLTAPRRGDPGWLQARPVLERLEPRRALPHDRPRDLGADRRRDRCDRRLRRHGRLDHRDRPLPEGAQARPARRRRRPRGLGVHRRRDASGPRLPRRGDRQGHLAGDPRPRASSTAGSASPIATRSSPRAAWRGKRACSSVARPVRRRGRHSSWRRSSVPARAS